MTLYFAETTVAEQRDLLCRWTERFYNEKRRVQILVDSTPAARFIDQLLWTFSQASFIPHIILNSGDNPPEEPVLITLSEIHAAGFDAVICDSPAGLDFMSGFDTAVHFILRDDAERRQESRVLWQRARDIGITTVHCPYGCAPEMAPKSGRG